MGGAGGNNKFLYGLCASDNGERRHSISGGVVRLALPQPPREIEENASLVNIHNYGSMAHNEGSTLSELLLIPHSS